MDYPALVSLSVLHAIGNSKKEYKTKPLTQVGG